MRIKLVVACTATLTLAVAGCGSDDYYEPEPEDCCAPVEEEPEFLEENVFRKTEGLEGDPVGAAIQLISSTEFKICDWKIQTGTQYGTIEGGDTLTLNTFPEASYWATRSGNSIQLLQPGVQEKKGWVQLVGSYEQVSTWNEAIAEDTQGICEYINPDGNSGGNVCQGYPANHKFKDQLVYNNCVEYLWHVTNQEVCGTPGDGEYYVCTPPKFSGCSGLTYSVCDCNSIVNVNASTSGCQ